MFTAYAANSPPCEDMDMPRVLGRLTYVSVKPSPKKKDGTCSIKITYTDRDGITKYWMFDQRGRMTFAIDLQTRLPPFLLTQNFVFPGQRNPQIRNLSSSPPKLEVTAASGSKLVFDVDKGEFLPESVPNLKYLSNFEIREDIAGMTQDLKRSCEEENEKCKEEKRKCRSCKEERKKYVDSNPNRDLATVEGFQGEYLKYKAKFGDTADSVKGFGLEVIQNLSNSGKKVCALLADEFMKKDGPPELRRFNQVYTPERIAAVKASKCETQPSWKNGIYPVANTTKPASLK